MINPSLLTFILLVTSLNSIAQDQDTTINIYYKSFSDKLGIYAYGITKFSKFDIADKSESDYIMYGPNENFNLGLGFNYKWMGIGFAFNFGAVNDDEAIYGKTKSFDTQIDIYSRKWIWAGNFQYYKGYYWTNPDDFIPDWDTKDSVIIRPDIETFVAGFSGLYTFKSDRFSFKAAYTNTEWQKKSAGSWITGMYLSIYSMAADSSLVPFELRERYPKSDGITALSSFSLGGAFGYSHTFVIKKHFYTNLSLIFGLNLQSVSVYDTYADKSENIKRMGARIHSRFAIGYNHERWYTGITAIVDNYVLENSSDSELSYQYGKVRIFYGRRFNIGK